MKDYVKKRVTLAIQLVFFVFGILLATVVAAGAVTMFLFRLELLRFVAGPDPRGRGDLPFAGIRVMLGMCVILGTALTAFFSRYALNPIRRVIDATNRVAEGDYSMRINVRGVPELEELSQSFNKMTQALSSVETLRRDFINNFSHELKTPVVSILGFARLLKSETLTDEEREEYTDIIIAESSRLVTLSTNVLNLSKYETLEIVQDKNLFRLDEQIRRAVLLLEPHWSARNISIDLELDRAIFEGNEDLTLQIWLNLVENAIKFSEMGGVIRILLKNTEGNMVVTVQDEGCGIDEDAVEHIFDRFYQADSSRASAGNGLGLTLVKRIVELCDGTIAVESKKWVGSTFTVHLNSMAKQPD